VVGFAIRRLEREPVGLLCAQRTTSSSKELPLDLGHARLQADLVPVGGLSLGALHRLLRTRLGMSLPHPALRRIEAGSDGNPFLALEIGRALARRGISSAGTAAMPVPDSLSGLVSERLGELPPAVLEAARLVAVMPEAPIEQYLAAGAGGPELDAAVLAGVLEPDAGRLHVAARCSCLAPSRYGSSSAAPPGQRCQRRPESSSASAPPLWLARAQAELARVSGRAPGPAELTATERRVAELVASGMSNREVAAELFVTVRAVESTLTKTYAKLGVRSRTELAARLHRGG
jgi:DNA-binding CsgD family transcriptional regulator